MLKVLLAFLAINAVYCQYCPQFAAFNNNDEILPLLNGTFYEIYTSSDNVIPCEKRSWTGTGNELVGISQSPGCCRRLFNTDLSNPNQVSFLVAPITYGAGCLTTTETVIYKFIATTGSGDNLCVIFSACRVARQGVYVMCRQQIPTEGLLAEILSIVTNLLSSVIFGLLYGIPDLKPVNQTNCIFPDNNCFL